MENTTSTTCREMRHQFNVHEHALVWEHSGGKGTYAEYSAYGQRCDTRTVYATYADAVRHFERATGQKAAA